MKTSLGMRLPLLELCLAASVAVLCADARAGLFPKIMKQMPKELQGEYVLLGRINPDKSHEEFTTNALPFATVLSNRVVLADRVVKAIEAVIRVRQKGTNVHLVSFEGKESWVLVPGHSASQLVVLQPDKNNPKAAPTFLVIGRTEVAGTATNAAPEKGTVPRGPAGTPAPAERRGR